MSALRLSSAVKKAAGLAVTRYAPTMIKYLAPVASREKFSVAANDWFLDIRDKRSQRVIRISRANAVYLLDMMSSFDYYFDSTNSVRVKHAGETIDLADFSTPRFHKVSGFADFPVMCSSLTEPFVTAQQYLDFAILKQGDIAIDLGSYSCLTSIAFSKAVGPQGKVVAIEPDPLNHACCGMNLLQHSQSNGLSNVELLNVAVSGAESFLEFSSEGSMGSSAAHLVGTFRGDVIRVPCMTLEGLSKKLGLFKVDFVKMDIEGSEQAVLDSSRGFFMQFRPKIIVEPHMVNGKLSDQPVIAALTSYGYDCSVIPQTGVDLPLVLGIPRT